MDGPIYNMQGGGVRGERGWVGHLAICSSASFANSVRNREFQLMIFLRSGTKGFAGPNLESVWPSGAAVCFRTLLLGFVVPKITRVKVPCS